MVTVEQAAEEPREHLGRDLIITRNNDLQIGSENDFVLVIFYENLEQAIKNRLRTQIGELILHLEYGSRLQELVGARSTNLTLSLAKQHVRESLLQEPRIAFIDKIAPTYREGSSGQIMDIDIEVTPIGELTPLNLVYSLFL